VRPARKRSHSLGYRHIDIAEMYGNEEVVGAAIAASGSHEAKLMLAGGAIPRPASAIERRSIRG
jgi:diketogulonate reductase-like aldo/keto reductase